MTRRRGKQEGSIFQRKDGRWVAQVTVAQLDGTRKLVARYFSTQSDARRALTSMKSRQDAHKVVTSGRGTVREWLDVWLDTFIKPNRSPRTYADYHNTLLLHIPEHVAYTPLVKLAPETVQRVLNIVADDTGGRTADKLRAILRSALNRAVKVGRTESNPVLATDPVKYAEQDTLVFTPAEAQAFIAASADHRLGALFLLALTYGFRKGEVCGLKATDLDFEAREIRVRRSLSWVKLPGDVQGHWLEREPKNASMREEPMLEMIYRALVLHIARRDEEARTTLGWSDSGYLFVTPIGAPIHGSNLSEEFHDLCRIAGVPRLRFHDMRHCCGTFLHLGGASPFTIQKVLGHAQLSTTKRYTRVPMSVKREALGRLEALLIPSGDESATTPVTVNVTVNDTMPRLN